MKSGLDAMPLFLLDDLLSKYLLTRSSLTALGKNFLFNISTWRKRGVASNPLFIIPGFFLHFSLEPSYGYLRFEGNGKIPLGR